MCVKNEDSFEGVPILTNKIDLDEKHCPSKVIKLGTNPNTSSLIRIFFTFENPVLCMFQV